MAVYTQIDNPELYFQCKLYTGNGSDDHAMTFDNTDTSMQPDMVWMKSRTQSGYNHYLVDAVRGVTKAIRPNLTNDEDTYSDAFKSFDSNGFTLDDDTSNSEINQNTKTYVAWCWKESTTAGFDIVSYTGTGSNQTIAHGLSAALDFIIVKNRATTNQWCVYSRSRGAEKFIHLDANDGESDASTPWQDTEPTSSVFSVGASNLTNGDGNAMIAYCFAPIQGFSRFGSYIGNGNNDGPFVHTGFRPAWVMCKGTASNREWVMHDNKRDAENVVDGTLYANTNDAEGTGTARMDFLSNGFKLREDGNNWNASGETYIYMAFAEAPFVNSNGVPANAR